MRESDSQNIEDTNMQKTIAVMDKGNWLANKIQGIKKTNNLSSSVWVDAPMSVSMSSTKNSKVQIAGLWEQYGNGKLCQQDTNARSGLRNTQSDV